MARFADLAQAVIAGDVTQTKVLTERALAAGATPDDLLHSGLMPAMEEVGDRMAKNSIFIPEVLMAAKAMHAATDVLRPHLGGRDLPSVGRVVIGTVKGDLHNIGKNLVAMVLEATGFQVQDLGIDVSPETFVEAVKAQKPDILGMSALLTTTKGAMRETVESLNRAKLREQVKVMIGGVAVNQAYADDIGADAYAPDAGMAVQRAKALLR